MLRFQKYFVSLLFSIFTLYQIQAVPEKIWIDTDISIGKIGHDVDDGLALIMALRSPQIEIVGISLVTNPNYGDRICKKIIKWYGDGVGEIPVYKGAKRSKELGQSNSAVIALSDALRKEKLTIIALGPVTNIATVLMLHPELKGQISQIIWCAGRRPFLDFNPGRGKINVCDCNFDQATEAGQILLSSGVKILLSGYEPASSIYISLSDISGLKKSENPVCRWLYYRLKNWSKIWSFFLGSKKGFIPFDAVTLGSFLYPELTLVRAGLPAVIEENKSDMPSFFKSKKSYLLATQCSFGS